MSIFISNSLRQGVAERANFCCEYCLLSERVSFFKFHIDHIISTKHGGVTNYDNLAFSCPDCNFYKGTDIATFIFNSEKLVRFFNPRSDLWESHFELIDATISGKTEIGHATVQLFKFNSTDRLIFRKNLIDLSLFP